MFSRSRVFLIAFFAFFVGLGRIPAAEPPRPLVNAHAHNDYEHKRPLFDALEHGFTNVEADVYLTPHGLLVAHDVIQLKPDRTLQSLYLDPLRQRVRDNKGFVLSKEIPFTLLVDIKTDGETTYAAIDKVLADYAEMLTVTRDGKTQPGAVTIVISGNRPIETIRKQTVRYAGIDGRSADLKDSTAPSANAMPWISDRWGALFKWNGDGPMPAAERMQLQELSRTAHAQHRRLRFWATPEKPAVWNELINADVDLVGTDRLDDLQSFLNGRHSP